MAFENWIMNFKKRQLKKENQWYSGFLKIENDQWYMQLGL